MNTITLKIPLYDERKPFDERINELCDVQLAAGYRIASTFIIGRDLYLIFQKIT